MSNLAAYFAGFFLFPLVTGLVLWVLNRFGHVEVSASRDKK